MSEPIVEIRMRDKCGTCAFRSGTYPNQDGITLIKAKLCADTATPFLCHEADSLRRPSLLRDQIILGDCLDVLSRFPSQSVNLVVTSPPYADRRKRTYGGVNPDEYVAWFLPIAEQLRRVLNSEGSFVLNIKEPAEDGERHTYVIELILGMKKQGWLWTEEYIWHKKNCYPGKWPNRFRDAWERCLHFTKQRQFKMYQDAVMVPTGDWAQSRLRSLSATDRKRDESRVEMTAPLRPQSAERPALQKFRTALNALYLEVEPSIANDIVDLANAAITEAEAYARAAAAESRKHNWKCVAPENGYYRWQCQNPGCSETAPYPSVLPDSSCAYSAALPVGESPAAAPQDTPEDYLSLWINALL
jgi:hypothetical protein